MDCAVYCRMILANPLIRQSSACIAPLLLQPRQDTLWLCNHPKWNLASSIRSGHSVILELGRGRHVIQRCLKQSSGGILSGRSGKVAKARHGWIIGIAAAATVVSLGLHASHVVRLLAQQDTGPVVHHDQMDVEEPRIDMDSILALLPFGQPIGSQASSGVMAAEPRLTLHGVVRADPISRSSAILSVGTEPARSFGVGDEVAGGRRLVEIRSDHVLLETGNQREILSLTDASPPALAGSDNVARSAGATGDLDALRQLIFDQVNDQGDAAPATVPGDGS